MKLDDLDQDRFECMMKRLELQMLWVAELARRAAKEGT